MSNRKISIDLSPLWQPERETIFVVRYQDINITQQMMLSNRIKQVAPQYRLRKDTGPTPLDIHNALIEMNPIMVSECTESGRRSEYYNSKRAFGQFDGNSLLGCYAFDRICQMCYRVLCVARPLNRSEIERIVRLTTRSWDKTDRFMLEHFPNENHSNHEERSNVPTEMGLEDIENVRLRAEENGANRIPARMLAREEPPASFNTAFPNPNEYAPDLRAYMGSLQNENPPIRSTPRDTVRIGDLQSFALDIRIPTPIEELTAGEIEDLTNENIEDLLTN